MSDETERPEDTARRFAGQIQELEAWKAKYSEAAELWDALDPAEGQRIVSAVLIGKMVSFEGDTREDRAPTISISATDDVDWMDQMGIVDSAYDFIHTDPWHSRD